MAINLNHYVGARRFGVGQNTSGNSHFNRGQICVFSQTVTNGTYNIRTQAQWSENGYAGHFYLSATSSGQGTCRVYRITGRYASTTFNMLQGGNRGAGEDCVLQVVGGSNDLGIQVVVSGYSNTVEVVVVYVGATNFSDDYWMID
jgi:hypothetical protein